MPIVYYPCLTFGQAWDLTEILSAFLKYRHMADRNLFQTHKELSEAADRMPQHEL